MVDSVGIDVDMLCLQVVNHMPLRSATLGNPNRRDFIEELTKQLDTIQKVREDPQRSSFIHQLIIHHFNK